MARGKTLKSKLRAASRRRTRRVGSGQSAVDHSTPPQTTTTSQVDVVGRLCCVLGEEPGLKRDQAATSALRQCLKLIESGKTCEDQGSLLSSLFAIQHEEGVTQRAYRTALNDLLEIAEQHRNTSLPDSFLSYLRILAS